jgi:hypothetical protein
MDFGSQSFLLQLGEEGPGMVDIRGDFLSFILAGPEPSFSFGIGAEDCLLQSAEQPCQVGKSIGLRATGRKSSSID